MHALLGILFVVVVAGFIWYVIDKAPIIAEPFKGIAKWLVLIVAGILVILFLARLLGVALPA